MFRAIPGDLRFESRPAVRGRRPRRAAMPASPHRRRPVQRTRRSSHTPTARNSSVGAKALSAGFRP